MPPFRDDIQLTVNEYRAKIYEIMSTSRAEKATNGVATAGGGGKGAPVGAFKAKTKKFISANNKLVTTNGEGAMEKGPYQHRLNPPQDNCSCPLERMANGYKLEAELNGNNKNNKLQQPSLTNGGRVRNKVSCMPPVAEATAAAAATVPSKSKLGASRVSAAQLLLSSSSALAAAGGGGGNGVILPRSCDVARMNMNNGRNSTHHQPAAAYANNTEHGERGAGRGRTVMGGGGNGGHSSEASAMPQRCYENRLKVLEEKIRRHKQEMSDFLRVGNNNRKLASIQAAAANKQPVQAVVMQNGRLSDALLGGGGGGGGGKRIESKLSCSSSSTTSTSNQSLKQISQSVERPAFRCGCKPNATASSGLSRNGGGGGKLFPKSAAAGVGGGGGGGRGGPTPAVGSGFGVISASDLYKLRSSEIINQS